MIMGVHHTAISTPDLERLKSFYCDLFGLEEVMRFGWERGDELCDSIVGLPAPQLAAAGLGVAVCPVSAVTAGFPGLVRSFSPRWFRQLVAVTSTPQDPAFRAVHRQFADTWRARTARRANPTHLARCAAPEATHAFLKPLGRLQTHS